MASDRTLEDNVCLVTGATSGIGFEVARQLAALGAEVVMHARDGERGDVARLRVVAATGNENVSILVADLESQRQIRRAAAEFRDRHERLDVLVNNAGAVFPRRALTEDGIERTFAVNHLAYFLMTRLLLDRLEAGAPSRVINVSSAAHRRATFDPRDLEPAADGSAMQAYGQSKLANLLFTYELARRLEGRGVTVNAVHPGVVNTNFGSGVRWVRWLVRPFGRFLIQPGDAAAAIVELAAEPRFATVTGRYFVKGEERPSSRASYDLETQQRLWTLSEVLTARSASPDA